MHRRTVPWIRALVLCAAAPALAQAEELPTRKAGLWEVKMAMAPPLPAMTMQQCTDDTTDKQMSTMVGPMQKEMCSRKDVQKTATGYVIESACNIGPMATATHLEITGDFQSAYTVQVTSHASGGPAAVPRDTTITMQAKWLGACKPDQKPGDMVMPGGMKMNIKDLENLRALTKKQ
ncbi:MAG: DUF3617 domain-containing protein [Xanthobacteraceae bacterium]